MGKFDLRKEFSNKLTNSKFRLKYLITSTVLFGLIALVIYSCKKESPNDSDYQTKNVIIVVIDGPRYIDTWGDPERKYIPNTKVLSAAGVVCTRFYNNGETYTNQGHAAIINGRYENINNGIPEYPQYPSLMQCWLQNNGEDSTAAWILASKDKLVALADCKDETWAGKHRPSTDCGIDGAGYGSGYRNDQETFDRSIEVLNTYHPNLMLINFKEPDVSGHANNWINYVKGIEDTDRYVGELWNYIRHSSHYKDKTALVVTNDHGRHLDGVADGFKSHGDDCEGCRHINFFAAGPDFKQGYVSDQPREIIDIAATLAKILQVELPYNEGEVMEELLIQR